MEQELTPWFPPEVKPVRKGVYERRYDEGCGYSLWDGDFWRIGVLSCYDNAMERAASSRFLGMQGLPWRGLAKDPHA